MFVSYKIALAALSATTTATTINIPINMEYQIVDNSELIETVFVENETQNAVNKILDYDKVKFKPFSKFNNELLNITYNLSFLDSGIIKTPTYFSDIEFTNNDIIYRRNAFTQSYLLLEFYDSDNPMLQNLLFNVLIYNTLNNGDYYPKGVQKPNIPGQPISVDRIQTKMVLYNPEFIRGGKYEGIYLYDYKDEYSIGSLPKDLYMKATYNNAKTGKSTNMMTESVGFSIDNLIKKLYTKYTLYRDSNNFYYKVDDTYSTNVSYINNSHIIVNLYEIQAL